MKITGWCASTLSGIAIAFCLVQGTASAGECPAANVLTKPRDVEKASEKGLTRETLAVIDVTGWRKLGDLRLRTRRLTVAPHGRVPYHTHDDRPSIVFVVSGEIWEHSAYCSVPILHKAGEWTPEFGHGHAHWWENRTGHPVVLTSSDIVPPDMLDAPDNDM